MERARSDGEGVRGARLAAVVVGDGERRAGAGLGQRDRLAREHACAERRAVVAAGRARLADRMDPALFVRHELVGRDEERNELLRFAAAVQEEAGGPHRRSDLQELSKIPLPEQPGRGYTIRSSEASNFSCSISNLSAVLKLTSPKRTSSRGRSCPKLCRSAEMTFAIFA